MTEPMTPTPTPTPAPTPTQTARPIPDSPPPAAPPPRTSRRDAAKEERLEVLRLLEGGSVTADEASALLDALDRADQTGRAGDPTEDLGFPPPPAPPGPPPAPGGRVFRVRITSGGAERAAVNVALPLGLIESGLDVARRFVPEFLPSAEAIRKSAEAGFRGHLIDIDEEGERVEIIIE